MFQDCFIFLVQFQHNSFRSASNLPAHVVTVLLVKFYPLNRIKSYPLIWQIWRKGIVHHQHSPHRELDNPPTVSHLFVKSVCLHLHSVAYDFHWNEALHWHLLLWACNPALTPYRAHPSTLTHLGVRGESLCLWVSLGAGTQINLEDTALQE